MKKSALILITIFFVAATSAFAAEKSKIAVQLDASRVSVDALAGKIGDNREAGTALEQARTYLQKASDLETKGRQRLGFTIPGLSADLKPEVEEEINNYLEISAVSVATATSRLEKAKASSEFEIIDKQLANVKAKIKVFEDRKAELEKLKADAAKCQSASKELETLKADNTRLSAQIEKQNLEIKALTVRLEEAKKPVSEPAKPEKTAPVPASLPEPVRETPSVK
jgi:DNA repair exonuclease SbcCD ATPase subunit